MKTEQNEIVELQKNMTNILIRMLNLSKKEQYRLLKQFKKMVDNDIELLIEEIFQKAPED